MEVINWANGKGITLVLAPSEVDELIEALKKAKTSFHEELDGIDIDVDVSPILDEEVKHGKSSSK